MSTAIEKRIAPNIQGCSNILRVHSWHVVSTTKRKFILILYLTQAVVAAFANADARRACPLLGCRLAWRRTT